MRRTRGNFRKCRICKQGNKEKQNNASFIQTCNCESSSIYVHKKCQATLMEEQGIIKCPDCDQPFRGLQYDFTNKSFWQYVWESENGRNALWTNICLLISMIMSVWSLSKTLFVDWDDFVNRISDFDLLPMTLETAKFDFNIVMMVHLKIFLPISSIFLTIRQVWNFWINYQSWRLIYFNVTIREPIAANND